MYEYADTAIKYLNKLFIKEFQKARVALMNKDEVHVIDYAKDMYARMAYTVKEQFVKVAVGAYEVGEHMLEDVGVEPKEADKINFKWVNTFLDGYNPLTKYVFNHEVDRKAMYFAESILSTNFSKKEFDKALRYWATQVQQYAIDITDKAMLTAFILNGIVKVKWVTTLDEKTCSICETRDGNIYKINRIPPKPHFGCRCYYVPIISV